PVCKPGRNRPRLAPARATRPVGAQGRRAGCGTGAAGRQTRGARRRRRAPFPAGARGAPLTRRAREPGLVFQSAKPSHALLVLVRLNVVSRVVIGLGLVGHGLPFVSVEMALDLVLLFGLE